jgi:squalene cyclase
VALVSNIKQALEKKIEAERIVRVAFLITESGDAKQENIFQKVINFCVSTQKPDGGWIGVEDTIWFVALLKKYSAKYSKEYTDGLEWLKKQQLDGGGWGKNSRDFGRIPITALLLYLLPELVNKDSLCWLENQWKSDFFLDSKLTYKSAFCLMALKKTNHKFADGDLFVETLKWLESQQNEDFGWGPWKGHPVGSSPFCTGVALTGLLQYPDKVDRNVIVNGIQWIEKNQLEDGLWADHYIEEGSAWCFYALTEGYKFLKGSQ